MTNEFLQDRRRGLEEEFFARENQELLGRLRETQTAQERKAALRAASGISDEVMLDRFIEMDLSPETVAALTLAPLVHVAWSDGSIDRREREAILANARGRTDIAEGALASELLESWLDTRPDERLFDAWQGYVRALMQEMDEETTARFRDDVMKVVREVAESAGGTLGMGRVSRAERDSIASVEQALS